MRSVELAKVAVAAEGLHLRRFARRQAMRVAYGAGAAVFGLAALVVLHFAIYIVLARWLGPIWAVFIVLLLDAVGAGVLGALAFSGKPDAVEQEARDVRAQALIELRRSLTAMSLAAEVGGAVLRRRARTEARRSMAGTVAMLVSRLIGR